MLNKKCYYYLKQWVYIPVTYAAIRVLNVLPRDLYANTVFMIILSSVFLSQHFDVFNDGNKTIMEKFSWTHSNKGRGTKVNQ